MTNNSAQTPFSAKLSFPPTKKKNSDLRTREYLSFAEVESLRKAARAIGRYGHRDGTLILLMFRHGFRVCEATSLRWEQVDLKIGLLHVKRRKNGIPSTHPLRSIELRALRSLNRQYQGPYVFQTERKAPLSARTVHHIVQRAGERAGFSFSIHPHMLRHSTGYHLANKGNDTRAIQSYLGHRNIKNTVIYTELSAKRFDSFWED